MRRINTVFSHSPKLVVHLISTSNLRPPQPPSLIQWTGSELVKMIGILGLSGLEPALREQVSYQGQHAASSGGFRSQLPVLVLGPPDGLLCAMTTA